MSVTPQMQRTTPTSAAGTASGSLIKKGTWSKCFPSKFSTETSSFTFVKKLVTVAVSNISYLRTMFPEKAYATKSLDGLSIKVLKANNDCPEARKLARWLLGAFDALEKKYLRELILVVYEDEASPEIVQEAYTFKFSYPDGQANCQLLQGKKEVQTISENDIYKSTQNLLRTLVIITQGMSPIKESNMTMKLTYYDEVTPSDYEPEGFLPTPLVQLQLPTGSEVKSGCVSTLFHSIQLGVQAVTAGEAKKQISPQENLQTHPGAKGNVVESTRTLISHSSNSMTDSLSIKDVPAQPTEGPSSSVRSHRGIPTPQSLISQATSSTSLMSETSETNSGVKCTCLSTKLDPLMLKCYNCSFEQHASCYRILRVEDIPTQHCCVPCSIELGIVCTDPKLVKMSSNPNVAGTCLFRRFLFFLAQVDIVSVEVVMEKLGIAWSAAEALVCKVGELGCLEDDEVDGQWKVIKEALETTVIPKFIGKRWKKRGSNGGGAGNSQARELPMTCFNQEKEKSESGANTENSGAKCSVVADTFQVQECGEKRRLNENQEVEVKRSKKKKKVSGTKGNLQI